MDEEDRILLLRLYDRPGLLYETYCEVRSAGASARDALEEVYNQAGTAKMNRGLVRRFIQQHGK